MLFHLINYTMFKSLDFGRVFFFFLNILVATRAYQKLEDFFPITVYLFHYILGVFIILPTDSNS